MSSLLAKPTHVNMWVVQPLLGGEQRTDNFSRSIRFAPPLVIEDSDLRKGISIIEESLRELDQVRIESFVLAIMMLILHRFLARPHSGRRRRGEGNRHWSGGLMGQSRDDDLSS
jgi:hypothetical protein